MDVILRCLARSCHPVYDIRMSRNAHSIDDVREMNGEAARLMADRLGGLRRGEQPCMQTLLRRRGASLPRRIRRAARVLAHAELHGAQPKVARQLDLNAISRAYNSLTDYLQPLGGVSRWRNRALNFGASVTFGLLVLAAVVIWIMVKRGSI